jgi:hypothetical protein
MERKQLNDNEKLFCELYVNGCSPYAGNATRCYTDVFLGKKKTPSAGVLANQLLLRPEIKEYVTELVGQNAQDADSVKRFLSQNLMKIIEEATESNYYNSHGEVISPAAMRSVAVNAAKALMSIHPVKESSINKINIEGHEGGITFNVIVPDSAVKREGDNG